MRGWGHLTGGGACFNSTLVQLKEIRLSYVGSQKLSFNSTLVQLKVCSSTIQDLVLKCFNSTLVQLKGHFYLESQFAA